MGIGVCFVKVNIPHIIASGIQRVVYIEPYPKSIAKELYKDSIVVDPDISISSKVKFEPFVGVAPRRYMEFFSMTKRKDELGRKIDWIPENSIPLFKRMISSYILLEQDVVEFLPKAMEAEGLKISV